MRNKVDRDGRIWWMHEDAGGALQTPADVKALHIQRLDALERAYKLGAVPDEIYVSCAHQLIRRFEADYKHAKQVYGGTGPQTSLPIPQDFVPPGA